MTAIIMSILVLRFKPVKVAVIEEVVVVVVVVVIAEI